MPPKIQLCMLEAIALFLKSLNQPGQALLEDCVSILIVLITDNSPIKAIRVIFLERLFPSFIIYNVCFNLLRVMK